MKKLLVGVALAVAAMGANAYVNRGIGTVSCAEINIKEKGKAEPTYPLHQWMMGYVTGVEAVLSAAYQKKFQLRYDNDALYYMVLGKCMSDPTLNLEQAAWEVLRKFPTTAEK